MTAGDLRDFLQPFTDDCKIMVECTEGGKEYAIDAAYITHNMEGHVLIHSNLERVKNAS